ncbi:MAG: 7TM diverse intracellular signaling domain-containing protein [Bacteroidota bacterium]
MKKLSIRIALLTAICWGVWCPLYSENSLPFTNGFLDLSDFHYRSKGSIELNGIWEFHWNELIDPNEIVSATHSPEYVSLPGVWNGVKTGEITLTGQGFATYRLKVRGSFKGEHLAIEMPAVYNAYKLWVNQVEVAKNGSPSSSFETSTPQWLPLTEDFYSTSDTLDIVIHVSNFRHEKGGISEPIVLGTLEALSQRRAARLSANILEIIGLTVISIAFLIFYFASKRDISLMLFSGLCLDWALRASCTDLYLLVCYFPNFNWSVAMKLEYMTLYIAVILGTMFIAKTYPNESNKIFRNLVAVVSGVFILVTLLVNTVMVSYLLTPFLIFAALIMLYVLNIVLTAAINNRAGAVYSSLGAVFLILVWFYDLLAYHSFFEINHILLSFGYLLTFSTNAMALIYKKKKTQATAKNYS